MKGYRSWGSHRANKYQSSLRSLYSLSRARYLLFNIALKSPRGTCQRRAFYTLNRTILSSCVRARGRREESAARVS